MSADDWYRNTEWNNEIEEAFFKKLKRARQKEQYLRIQAYLLSKRQPHVALRLLEEYFKLEDKFDHASAYVVRATAYISLGDLGNAINSYENALKREDEFPTLQTLAYIELPYTIATYELEDKYAQCLEILEKYKSRCMFPVHHFQWHSAKALVLHATGDASKAREHAIMAIEAANKDESGFRYHPSIGLVNKNYEPVQAKIKKIANT
jgi:tetratricopeptide (TPR) repeat protein